MFAENLVIGIHNMCLERVNNFKNPGVLLNHTLSVADLGEGPRGPRPPLFVEYLQKIYKKVTEISIQKPF